MKLPSFALAAGHKNVTNEPRVITLNKGHAHEHYRGNYTSTTKYNVVTYFPKALFEQFRPATTFAPLIFVLGVSMVKELVEDVKRWRADREINARSVLVYTPDSKAFVSKRWRDIKVGDIVQIQKDSFFPADLLVLAVPESVEGIAYVETINLDGESNLKIKKALDETQDLKLDTLPGFTLLELQAEVRCEQPNASLYTFTGNLVLSPGQAEEQTVPLSQASLLLRGSSLRNTKFVYGAVIFAGHESKVMMNATLPPSKRSRVEREMDLLILFMFALLLAMCLIGAITFAYWTHHLSPNYWYLRPDSPESDSNPNKPGVVFVDSFVASFILYGYLIPISLYVSMEMVKVFQSGVFIGRDRAMYHSQSDTPAQARTSNLNEELGMVNTILSDKTGTLTCNRMDFFKASIAGVSYGQGITEIEKSNARRTGQLIDVIEDPAAVPWKQASFNFYDKRIMGDAWLREARPAVIKEFFRVLAVCHTVIPEGPAEPAKIKYEAESPDEAALVAAGKVFGFFFYKRTNTTVFVRETEGTQQRETEYEILNILEFDSTRKRMSIICRTPEGKLKLYCKGADTVIYERLAVNNEVNDSMKGVTREHMEQYGAAGLRTLCLAYCELDQAEYDLWQEKYFEAKTALVGRDEKVAAVGDLIEQNLLLLGCTAIEDKLQEGVPEAIERLANAGIRIWVLTGDKQETAINIGFACSLLRNDMIQYIISANLPEVLALEDTGRMEDAYALAHSKIQEQLQDALKCMAEAGAGGSDNALIIDGKALLHGLAPDVKASLLQVGQQCAAVICCRVSPKQKALVTALVKTTGDTTLGIGDGANDVGMIQEAHIGVGISGQEGMQAVMSSDFSIAQFRFLETLLLVHGRWSYARITRMVSFFFYKNLLFGLTIFFFNCVCFFSGQTLYNDFYMSLYNVVFTAMMPLIVGTMDIDVNREMSRKYPGLYQAGPRNKYFDLKAVTGWLLNSAFQAVLVFVLVMGCLTPLYPDRHGGATPGQWQTGATLFTAVVITVHLEISTIIEHWTIFHVAGIVFSVGIWFVYMLIYGVLPQNWSAGVFHLFEEVMAPSVTFWLLILMAPVACVLPGYLWRQLRTHLHPDDKRIVAEIELRTKCGQLARVKSLHPYAGPLSPKLMQPSMPSFSRPSFINTGYVPQDKPGASGYFTPRASALHANECFNQSDCTQRNPVLSQLHGELKRNPFRHRSDRKLHSHVQVEGGDLKQKKDGKSRLRPPSSQTGSNSVILTADGKINAQRAQEQDDTGDQVKAFTPVDQPLRDQYAVRNGQGRDSLRPVRTIMPSAGSGPLPTPHAVPHQSPPAQAAQAHAVVSNMHSDVQEQQQSPASVEGDASNAVTSPLMGGSSPHVPEGVTPRGHRPRPNRTAPK